MGGYFSHGLLDGMKEAERRVVLLRRAERRKRERHIRRKTEAIQIDLRTRRTREIIAYKRLRMSQRVADRSMRLGPLIEDKPWWNE